MSPRHRRGSEPSSRAREGIGDRLISVDVAEDRSLLRTRFARIRCLQIGSIVAPVPSRHATSWCTETLRAFSPRLHPGLAGSHGAPARRTLSHRSRARTSYLPECAATTSSALFTIAELGVVLGRQGSDRPVIHPIDTGVPRRLEAMARDGCCGPHPARRRLSCRRRPRVRRGEDLSRSWRNSAGDALVPNGGSAGGDASFGLLSRVLTAHPTVEIVLLSPLVKDPVFTAEFAHPRVVFEDLSPHRPHGLEARLLAIVQAGYLTSEVTESVRIRRAEAVAKGTIRWMRAKRALGRAIAPSMIRPATRWDVSDRWISHAAADALFDRYKPALYVASSPGLNFSDPPLLRTSARRRAR